MRMTLAPLSGRVHEPPSCDHKSCDLVDALAAFQIGKNKGTLCAHSSGVHFHYLKVCTYQSGQVDFVYDKKIRASDTRAALARYFFSRGNVDDIDRQVGKLGAEGRREVVAAGFD